MKKIIVLFISIMLLAIEPSLYCAAQSDSLRTDSAQIQSAQKAQNSAPIQFPIEKNPFSNWKIWVALAVVLILSTVFSVSQWEDATYGDPDIGGCALFGILLIGGLIAIFLGIISKNLGVFFAFGGSCLFGTSILGKAIFFYRDRKSQQEK